MTDTYSPGSSPPEIGPLPHWEDVVVTGSGNYVTWTQTGLIPWEVEWEEGLQYAKGHYEYVSQFPNGSTNNGSCMAAALVVLFQEDDGNGVLSGIKSMVYISTIPRGRDGNGVHGRLSDPNRCHRTWKGHSYYWQEVASKTKRGETIMVPTEGPTEMHAEDEAINMMLNFGDRIEAARNAPDRNALQPPRVHWLGDMSMFIHGVQPVQIPGRKGKPATWTVTDPGQIWPCGPHATDPHNRKKPSCQEVLDRMGIKWRFGIIGSKSPTPEPQLPQYPPGYSGGNGGGGGGGGGGDHPGHASGHQPSMVIGGNAFTSDFFESAAAYVQNVIACRAYAAKHGRTPVHTSRSRGSSHKAVLPSPRNTCPAGTILQLLRKRASLSDSLAKMSLDGKRFRVQQPGVKAVHAQPPQPQHTTGVGRVTRPPGHVSSAATKKLPPTGPQVVVAQPHAKTVVGQQGATCHGGNVTVKKVPASATKH